MIIDITKGIYRRIYAGWIVGRRINRVSIGAALAFVHLHCVADDFGNLEAEVGWLKSSAFPRRDDATPRKIQKWIEELEAAKLIEPYRVGDEHFIHIIDFTTLQPGGKNGRRFKKFPSPIEKLSDSDRGGLVNPGESGGIRGNPVNPNQSGLPHVQVQVQVQDQVHNNPPLPPQGGERGKRKFRPPKENPTERLLKIARETAPKESADGRA